ncbi:glucose 6 phosphate 1 dehydrogenase [Gracilaria domingensis]|nr:glucose 6 phosphate 1 dehydrogenase [Gracilaria domingensis]
MEAPTLQQNGRRQTAKTKEIHDTKGDYYRCEYRSDALTVFVIGASGDLAKKKTYPSLYALYRFHYFPDDFTIVGYARSPKRDEQFRSTIKSYLKGGDEHMKDEFLSHCIYRNGNAYGDEEGIGRVSEEMRVIEKKTGKTANRLFYFAIPPVAFVPAAAALKKRASTHDGWSRFIVEKPFGSDSASFEKLNKDMSAVLEEKEMYRIDHYIGKEAVQNLLVMRFANSTFEPLWNNKYIDSVIISFKEDFGTKGRGGYFDKNGMIRDVVQNHIMQIVTMFAMEPPVRPHGDYIRDEKVRVLQAIPAIKKEDCITGQYVADDDGREQSYTADEGVPDDSKTETGAAMVMYINNSRWEGVPFILRAGKALNENKSEIRVQFKKPPGSSLMFDDEAHGDGRGDLPQDEHQVSRSERRSGGVGIGSDVQDEIPGPVLTAARRVHQADLAGDERGRGYFRATRRAARGVENLHAAASLNWERGD